MKKKIILIASVFFIGALTFSFINDDDPFNLILKKLEEYNKNSQQEKVYLQLDKPYYAVGDLISFKAYLINTVTAEPSNISKVLYAELISEDSVVRKLSIPLSAGIGWGEFSLNESLPEGNYRIRAYTNWMRNASASFFYDKTLKIGNSWTNSVYTKATFTYNKDAGGQKVNVKIRYADKNKIAYISNEVNYKVEINGKQILVDRGKTNSSGELSFSFINKNPLLAQGKITTSLIVKDNEEVTKVIPIKATSKNINIQFLPEGGNFIENMPNKVAVKAINENGTGEDISISIKDRQGNELTTLKTQHLGMGSFILTPQTDNQYTAHVIFADGSDKNIELPKAQKSGYILSANNIDSSKIAIKILLSEDLVNKGNLKLIAQHNNQVYYSIKPSSQKQLISTSISTEKLPPGIIHLTLFSADNIPVAERLVFVSNRNNQLDIDLENPITKSTKTAKVSTQFKASKNGVPVKGSFSVAVNNISKVTPDELNESNILTSFLLTSDLTGYIEKPNYYFLKNNAETRDNLDLLMLTQGWGRFVWKEFLENKAIPITYQPEKSLSISGTVTTLTGKPIPNAKVFLFASSGKIFAIDTLADDKGHFNFDNMFFADSTKFMVKAEAKDYKRNISIKMDQQTAPMLTSNKNEGDIEINVNESIMDYLNKNDSYLNEMTRLGIIKKSINLKTIDIVASKKLAVETANLNGTGIADAIITDEDLKNSFSIKQYLDGRYAGIKIMDDQAYLTRSSTMVTTSYTAEDQTETPMQIYIDGAETKDETVLANMPVSDVQSIEVLKSVAYTFVYGTNSGVILITTKTGKQKKPEDIYVPGILAYKPNGYYFSKEFYMPKYPATNQINDYRSTIFWKPNMVSDKDGKANFEYFNANENGKYRVIIEGIDTYGNLAHKVYTYDVN